MYILGFLFLFIGLSLLLYSILILLFSKETAKGEKKNILQSFPKKNQTSSESTNIPPSIEMEPAPSSSNHDSKTFQEESFQFTPKSEQENKDLQMKKEVLSTKFKHIKSPLKSKNIKKEYRDFESQNLQKHNIEDLELYLTGYLYCDPAHTSYTLLEKKDRTPSENLSHLTRLGNAILEWNKNRFILSYDEKQISLFYYNLKEIRFTEECAIFITKEPGEPYYFFLSNHINVLKSFLLKLSNN